MKVQPKRNIVWVKENGVYSPDHFGTQYIVDQLKNFRFNDSTILQFVGTGSKSKIKIIFVGIISVGNCVIYSAPKFFYEYSSSNSEELNKYLRSSIQAIAGVHSQGVQGQLSMSGMESAAVPSWIAEAQFILEDFSKNGLLSTSQSDLEFGLDGDIDWSETFDLAPAVIQSGRPIYVHVYVETRNVVFDALLTGLHRRILSHIRMSLTSVDPLDGLGLSRLSSLVQFDKDEPKISNDTARILESELRLQYEDRKIRLIQSMIRYVEEHSSRSDDLAFNFIGTTSFHVVWEKACAEYFGDILAKKRHQILAPEWTYTVDSSFGNFETIVNADKRLVPDIVARDENDLYILDAKYYLPNFLPDKIRMQPGVHDITKQYMYVPAVRHAFTSLEVAGNAFIFPSCHLGAKNIVHRGKVEFPFLHQGNKNYLPIHLFEVDPVEILENFNDRKGRMISDYKQIFSMNRGESLCLGKQS